MNKILILHNRSDQVAGIKEIVTAHFSDFQFVSDNSGDRILTLTTDEQPDIILLGNLTSSSDKNEVCRKLKNSELTRHIPLLVFPGIHITSNNDDRTQIIESEAEKKADIVLTTPLTPNELCSHIRTLLRLKNAENKLLYQENILEEAILKRTETLQRELVECKRKIEEISRSEAEYRQMVQTSNDALFLIYNKKFEIINKKFQEMFRVTPQQVCRQDFDFKELVVPANRCIFSQRLLKLESGEKQALKFEYTALSSDGTEIDVEASVCTIKYKDGMAIQGVIRDITERKNLERQLRHSQKIEAISRLAGGIAHDFNNILAIIQGYTELSMDEFETGSTMHRNLTHILSASDRAKDLVNQILTFSRQHEEERQEIQLSRIIDETLRILQPMIPSTIEIRQHIDMDDGIVLANPTQIRQVLMNLCSNAAHAMRDSGGLLEVSLSRTDYESEKILGNLEVCPGSFTKLTVRDTGHGMTPDIVERIFDPYFTTKAAGEGSGMGLAVIHGIIKNHGGEITVYSELGKGTIFTLYLPEIAENPRSFNSSATITGGNERILFIDDERMITYMHREVLERLGYQVVSISNSIEALDLFRNDPEIFDLIITDQGMPGLTGIELAKQILKIRPDIPVILCTGYSETVTRQDALKIGIKEFIIKPIIKREIAGVIRKVLDMHSNKKEE